MNPPVDAPARARAGRRRRSNAPSAASSLSPPRLTNRDGGPCTTTASPGSTSRADLSATAPLTRTSRVDRMRCFASCQHQPRRTMSVSNRRRRATSYRFAGAFLTAAFFAGPSSPQPSWPGPSLRSFLAAAFFTAPSSPVPCVSAPWRRRTARQPLRGGAFRPEADVAGNVFDPGLDVVETLREPPSCLETSAWIRLPAMLGRRTARSRVLDRPLGILATHLAGLDELGDELFAFFCDISLNCIPVSSKRLSNGDPS